MKKVGMYSSERFISPFEAVIKEMQIGMVEELEDQKLYKHRQQRLIERKKIEDDGN